jgi:hypothetical protein
MIKSLNEECLHWERSHNVGGHDRVRLQLGIRRRLFVDKAPIESQRTIVASPLARQAIETTVLGMRYWGSKFVLLAASTELKPAGGHGRLGYPGGYTLGPHQRLCVQQVPILRTSSKPV